MNYKRIESMQKEYGYTELQNNINTGLAWKLEGSSGRSAMYAIETGMCMLPKESHRDYYGNKIPSRDELRKGSKGTYQNCAKFWEAVDNGEIFLEKEI